MRAASLPSVPPKGSISPLSTKRQREQRRARSRWARASRLCLLAALVADADLWDAFLDHRTSRVGAKPIIPVSRRRAVIADTGEPPPAALAFWPVLFQVEAVAVGVGLYPGSPMLNRLLIRIRIHRSGATGDSHARRSARIDSRESLTRALGWPTAATSSSMLWATSSASSVAMASSTSESVIPSLAVSSDVFIRAPYPQNSRRFRPSRHLVGRLGRMGSRQPENLLPSPLPWAKYSAS